MKSNRISLQYITGLGQVEMHEAVVNEFEMRVLVMNGYSYIGFILCFYIRIIIYVYIIRSSTTALLYTILIHIHSTTHAHKTPF